MTSSQDWMSINEAAERLHRTAHEVLEKAVEGDLESRLDLDHRDISAAAVEAELAEPRLWRDPTNPAEKAMDVHTEREYDEERTK